jgi:hypothetical protein
VTLSKEQAEAKERFQRFLWIWERDLLEAARRWPAWHDKAIELGFSEEKIFNGWMHADEGRQIAYRRIK